MNMLEETGMMLVNDRGNWYLMVSRTEEPDRKVVCVNLNAGKLGNATYTLEENDKDSGIDLMKALQSLAKRGVFDEL